MKSYQQFITESVKISIRDFPIICANPKMQADKPNSFINRFISGVNAAIDDGHIIMAQLKNLRSYGLTVVSTAFSALSEEYTWGGKWKNLPEVLQQYNFEPANLTLISSSLKKAENIKVDHQYKNDAIAILKELQKIESVLNHLKDRVGVRETKAEKDRREQYNAPQSTKDAKTLIRNVLMKMTGEVRTQYEKQIADRWLSDLSEFFAKSNPEKLKFLKLDSESVKALEDRNQEKARRYPYKVEVRTPHYIETLLSLVCEKGTFEPLSNWEELVSKQAVAQADDVQENFVSKNVNKLASIIEAKGNLDGEPEVHHISVKALTIEGQLRFKFTDGSSFNVRSKVVTQWRYNGSKVSNFSQYPTTFHDAVLPNGTRMPGMPSEEQMNNIFAKHK